LRQVTIGMIVGLIAGTIVGATVIRPEIPVPGIVTSDDQSAVRPDGRTGEPTGRSNKTTRESLLPPDTPGITHWRMTGTYATSLPVLGELPKRIESDIAAISNNRFVIDYHEPGTLVPPLSVFEAVRSGTIQAGISTPALWADDIPALQLFSSIPFGPEAREFLAWFEEGGGRSIFNRLYEEQGIHSLLCGIATPATSGWFKKPVSSVTDLQGLRMRISGLGARVMQRFGVSTEQLMNVDIVRAMETGALDAAEFSQPATDGQLGLQRTADFVYFPGWHQPATLYDLMINRDAWQALSVTGKAQIATVCGNNILRSLASADFRQFQALKKFTEQGKHLKTWPPALLTAFRSEWQQVARDLSKNDRNFRQTWTSLKRFREEYGIWHELSAP